MFPSQQHTRHVRRHRAEIHDVVGCAQGLLVMFHYDERVSQIRRYRSVSMSADCPSDAADRGLIENIEHANETRTDLGREPYTLCFSAGKRRCLSFQRKIVESDIFMKLSRAMISLRICRAISCSVSVRDNLSKNLWCLRLKEMKDQKCSRRPPLPQALPSSAACHDRARTQA